MDQKPCSSPLKVVAFLNEPRAWVDDLSAQADFELEVRPIDELTVANARRLTADALLIELDQLSDEDLLPILAAGQSHVQIGLTAGYAGNRFRAVELLLDRVAPVLGSSLVIGWTVHNACDDISADDGPAELFEQSDPCVAGLPQEQTAVAQRTGRRRSARHHRRLRFDGPTESLRKLRLILGEQGSTAVDPGLN